MLTCFYYFYFFRIIDSLKEKEREGFPPFLRTKNLNNTESQYVNLGEFLY